MRKYSLAFLFLVIMNVSGQLPYKYRVYLTDKQGSMELIKYPERLLPSRALARRGHHEVFVDVSDLPVAADYVSQLQEAGYPLVCTSRWMNTVVVSSSDPDSRESLLRFPFVKDVRLVWKDNAYQPSFFVKTSDTRPDAKKDAEAALYQLKVHHGDKLHQAGYRGEGMWIAVIDAGFLNVDKIAALSGNVLGTYDFVDPKGDIFATHPHGTNVLSVMTAPESSAFSGSAPGASYWLLRSEDSSSEYPVEEDYWIAAAEYADSVGVDVINSSLGYSLFDDPEMNYAEADIDGKSAFITRGATWAASKGILVVNSAGNERERPWKRISFPSDSPDILTVGAVRPNMEPAAFTSEGFVRDEYVKPDLSGMGDPAYLIDEAGILTQGSGTSFSTPVIAGLAACLWQSLPHLKNQEVIRLLRRHTSHPDTPDALTGYGLPNVYEAYAETTPLYLIPEKGQVVIHPVDTAAGIWQVSGLPQEHTPSYLRVINSSGRLVDNFRFTGNNYLFNLNHLEKGLYIISVQSAAVQFTQRIHLSPR
ncbi:MAG: S8 family serine peptidase [Bacteroidales bacterium]